MNPAGVGIQCLLCGDCIFSNRVHDFKHCKCGDAFIDGGFAYLRYGAKDLNTTQFVSRQYDKEVSTK